MKKLLPEAPIKFKGIMLLASPLLNHSVFEKSCVLIYKGSNKGHEGFVINKPIEKTVGDIMKGVEGKSIADLPIHYGGPVEPESINFLVLSTKEDKLHYKPFVSIEEAEYSTGNPNTIVLPCLGYSSWFSGQLELECKEHSWFYDRPDSDILSPYNPNRLWKTRLQKLSPYHRLISMSNGDVRDN